MIIKLDFLRRRGEFEKAKQLLSEIMGDKNILEELSKVTSLKSARIFNRINNNLPFMTGTIDNERIYETLKYLKEKNLNPVITIGNKTNYRNIALAEWGDISLAYPNVFNIKEKIYKMFNSKNRRKKC